MRVIAGSAGGLKLRVPKRVSRPTADRVREALFSILGDRVIGARVLDLFAGSGSLGIEALSRGAESVVFVEQSRDAAHTIRSNLKVTGLDEHAEVHARRVELFLRKGGIASPFDLIFVDPPYRKETRDTERDTDFLSDLLAEGRLPEFLAADGLMVLERMSGADELPFEDGWEKIADRRYGGTEIIILAQRRALKE